MEVTNAPVRNPDGPYFKIASGELTPVKDQGDGKLRLRTVVSSSIQDRSGDVVTRAALDRMAASAKGLTVFRNHSHKVPDDVMGYIEQAHVEQGHGFDTDGLPIWDLISDVVVNDDPKSLQTHKMVTDGTRLGVSIGAQIPQGAAKKNAGGGYTFDDLDLLEASIVGIPDNPRSWVMNAVKAFKAFSAENEDDEDVEKATVWMNTKPDGSVGITVEHKADETSAETPDDGGQKDTKKAAEPEIVKGDDELGDTDWEHLPNGDQDEADAFYAELDALGQTDETKSLLPEVLKAPLSSETRNNLPDSAFACPSKRKYPIHDKAHLRNALARCGDPSNDQCGCSTVRAAARKAGIGEAAKAVEPIELIKDADVVSATPDETPAQEASAVPESAGSQDTLVKSAMTLAEVVRSQAVEIDTLRKENGRLSTVNEGLVKAMADLHANYKLARTIVDKLVDTPLGRKAVFVEKAEEFTSLEAKFGAMYAPEVLKSLETTK